MKLFNFIRRKKHICIHLKNCMPLILPNNHIIERSRCIECNKLHLTIKNQVSNT